MAPSPEHDNEPKAPDKNDSKTSDSTDLRTNSDFLDDHLSTSRDLDLQDSSVSTLDDGQLKALLDEAINYKTPKDREGKSRIFKVLLQEAEEDERNARAASASGPQLARYYNAAARRQRGQGGRKGAETSVAVSTTQGGSLQDLVQAGLYEVERVERCGGGRRSGGGGSRRRHHHQHPVTGRTVSVSARQREGGSLPSNVNAGALYPSDLRLYTPDKSTTTTSTSTNTTTPSETMVESCTESSASQPPGDAAPVGPPRPDYTVIDLENTVDQTTDISPTQDVVSSSPVSAPPSGGLLDETATPEETRSLLQHSTRSNSYTTDSLPRYRYHGSESSTGSLEHQEAEKEEPAMEMTTTGSGRRHHSTSAFDGVPRHQYFNPLEEALHHHRIPRIRYTSRASLEVDGVSGAHGATTVDKGISFPQFQTHEGGATSTTGAASLQLDPEYNSVRCIVEGGGSGSDTASGSTTSGGRSSSQSVAIAPTQYRLLSVANPKIIHGVERFQHHNTTEKKGLDENGNAVSTTDSKKKKKCKVDRNVTVLKSENIPGHRAEIIENLDLLVKYIEEDDATSAKTKHHHNHHHNHHKPPLTTDKTKTLSMEKKRTRIKTKSEQNSSNTPVVKKSNSLEEISKTKFEDLMSEDPKKLRVKKQSTSEDGDRRNWGEEFYQKEPETDFHVVTKKKKSKKRTTPKPTTYHYHRIEHSGGPTTGPPPQAAPQRDRAEPQRRKSACSVPPSDKSADSSDVDSVHSLPVATVHRRDDGASGAQQASPSSTSYADIARTNGGSSSASSNCSSHSGSSNQGVLSQPGAPVSAWKLSPQPGPPVGPSITQTVPQNTSPALPPALRSEHFPELCGEKDSAPGALVAPEVSPLRLDSDFPTLGGEVPLSTPRTCRQQLIPLVAQFVASPVEVLPPGPPISAASVSINPGVPRALPRQTQTELKLNSDSVPTRTVFTNSAKPHGGIARRGGSSRPAVIILDDEQNGEALPLTGGPIQVSGLTFGFELNEQLLNDSDGDSACGTPPPRGATAPAEVFTARFVPPHAGPHLTETYNHDKIVTFVGLAWEDVIHQTNGKVQYYNGQ